MSIKKIIHPMAGTIAMLCIGSFWLSTLVSELFLSQDAIVLVKHNILQTMWVMIPAMAVTGGSGFALSGDRKGKTAAGEMDLTFYALQAVDLKTVVD